MSIEGEAAPQYTASSSGLSYSPAPTGNQYSPIELDTSGKSQSRSNQVHLMRAQWDDYEKRFAPLEDEQISRLSNADYYASQVQDATDAVGQAYNRQVGIQDRQMARYGVQADDAQRGDQMVSAGLSAGLATAQAANQTRDALKSRDIQVMSGGLVPADQVRQQQGS